MAASTRQLLDLSNELLEQIGLPGFISAGHLCPLFYNHLIKKPARACLVQSYDVSTAFDGHDDWQNLKVMHNFSIAFLTLKLMPNLRAFSAPDALLQIPQSNHVALLLQDVFSSNTIESLKLCGVGNNVLNTDYPLLQELDTLADLPNLQTLDLWCFDLSAAMNISYGRLPAKLKYLRLCDCIADETELVHLLLQLPNLQQITIYNAEGLSAKALVNVVYKTLGGPSSAIESIHLQNDEPASSDPAPGYKGASQNWLSSFPNLKALFLYGNHLTAEALSHLPVSVTHLDCRWAQPETTAYAISKWAKDPSIKRCVRLRKMTAFWRDTLREDCEGSNIQLQFG